LTRGVKVMDDPVGMPLEGAHARPWRGPRAFDGLAEKHELLRRGLRLAWPPSGAGHHEGSKVDKFASAKKALMIKIDPI
jgi:hypothetical protein